MNFGLIDCSKRLNALYEGPDNWPNRAFEFLFTVTGYKELTLGKSFAFSDHYLLADPHKMPRQVVEQICMTAASGRQEQPSYRDAVVSLCRQSRVETGGNADSFTVLPFVKVGEFIDEIRKSDTIHVDLYADFNGDKVPMAHLGKTAITLNEMDAERIRLNIDRAHEKHSYYWSIRGEGASSKLDFSSRAFELTELVAAIKSCADWSLFFNQRIEYPSLGYDLDANGNSNRILLACGMSGMAFGRRPGVDCRFALEIRSSLPYRAYRRMGILRRARIRGHGVVRHENLPERPHRPDRGRP